MTKIEATQPIFAMSKNNRRAASSHGLNLHKILDINRQQHVRRNKDKDAQDKQHKQIDRVRDEKNR